MAEAQQALSLFTVVVGVVESEHIVIRDANRGELLEGSQRLVDVGLTWYLLL